MGILKQIECPTRKDLVWVHGDVCEETNCDHTFCHYHRENHNPKKENPWQEKIVFEEVEENERTRSS